MPAGHVIDARLLAPASRCARVVVVRDRGSFRRACGIRISVDQAPVATLDAGEKVAMCLAPGEHVIDAARTGDCDATAAKVLIQASVAGAAETLRTGYSGRSVILESAPP